MRALRRSPNPKKQSFSAFSEGLLLRGELRKKRIVIVGAEFNSAVTDNLVKRAVETLISFGVSKNNISVIRVPGAFELPVMTARVIASKPRVHAVIALGALVRGQTAQYQLIAQSVLHGLIRVSVDMLTPVTCGLIVAETMQQAKARAGDGSMNRGKEAAVAALKLLSQFGIQNNRVFRKQMKAPVLSANGMPTMYQLESSIDKRNYSDA